MICIYAGSISWLNYLLQELCRHFKPSLPRNRFTHIPRSERNLVGKVYLNLLNNHHIKLYASRLRLDGIEQSSANAVQTEFVLPYRASAFQFHRYKLLMDLFLPSQNLIDVDEVLTVDEKCLLHKMISSAVRQWERGDESTVCPVSAEQTQNMASASSSRLAHSSAFFSNFRNSRYLASI